MFVSRVLLDILAAGNMEPAVRSAWEQPQNDPSYGGAREHAHPRRFRWPCKWFPALGNERDFCRKVSPSAGLDQPNFCFLHDLSYISPGAIKSVNQDTYFEVAPVEIHTFYETAFRASYNHPIATWAARVDCCMPYRGKACSPPSSWRRSGCAKHYILSV